jgi:hypothetical protein
MCTVLVDQLVVEVEAEVVVEAYLFHRMNDCLPQLTHRNQKTLSLYRF